jgi:hypothetical protein
MTKSRIVRVLIVLGGIAALALGAWTFIAWGWIETSHAEPAGAAQAFEAARAEFATGEPLVSVRDGAIVRRSFPESPVPAPTTFIAIVYHRSSERLVRAEVPFWFLQMKGPASERVLRGAGVDLQALGLTVDDLVRFGPALIFDASRGDDRVLLATR